MSARPEGDLDPAELEAAGGRALRWLADYLRHPARQRVLSAAAPGELRRALPAAPPAQAEPLERILDDFERLIPPALTHWNHPGFLAYFANTGSIPGILAELLTAGLNANGMLWRTAPAATELEEAMLDWLRQALGLPAGLWGQIADTASSSSLLALAAARQLACPGARAAGLAGAPRLRVYASDQAHSSIDKAVLVLGLGLDNLVKVASDAEFRMDPEDLERRIAQDRAAGFRPMAVVATCGTTATTSLDPLPAIGAIAGRAGAWLHVDAAYAGAAAIAPDLRFVLEGAELADSLVVNPHKWLFTPMDLSCLYTRRPEVLRAALSLVPDYLRTSEPGATNLMDYNFQLGRRFRALKLWFVLRAYGSEGIARRIRAQVGWIAGLARRIDAHPLLERLAPAPLSVVCFRVRPPGGGSAQLDGLNAAVLERVNASGEVFLSSARLAGRLALRIAAGNIRTGPEQLDRALDLVLEAADALRA